MRRLLPALRNKQVAAPGPPAPDTDVKVVLAEYYNALAAAGVWSPHRARPWPVERAVAEGYERIVWVFKATEAIAGNASRLPYRLKRGEETLDDHPLYQVLNKRANPMETGRQFRKRLCAQVLLSRQGAFVEVTRSRGGDIVRMDLLPPGRTRPVPGTGQELIDHYQVIRADGTRQDVPAENVRWFREPHPLDPYAGVTPLEAAGLSVELDFFARIYNVSFLKNDARPGGVLAVNGEMDPQEMDRLESRFGKGPVEAGKLSVVNGEVSYVDLATRPRDLQYGETSKTSKNEILAAFGCPESVLGYAADRTYANAEQELFNFWTVTMPPILDLLITGLDEDSEDDLEGYFDTDQVEILQKPDIARREEARAEFDMGLISPNEYRELAGYDEIDMPEARALYVATGKTPIPATDEDAAELSGGQGGQPGQPPSVPGQDVPPGGAGGQLEEPALPAGQPDMPVELPPATEPAAKAIPGPVAAEDAVSGSAFRSQPQPVMRLVRPPSRKATPETGSDALEGDLGDGARDKLEQELSAALTALGERMVARAVARLESPKGRKGTRHWQPDPAFLTDTRIGDKALDAPRAVDEDRWAEEAEDVAARVVAPAVTLAAGQLLRLLGQESPEVSGRTQVYGESAARDIVRWIGGAVRAVAERITGLANRMDQAGEPMEAITQAVQEQSSHVASAMHGIAVQAATGAVAGARDGAGQAIADVVPGSTVTRQWRTRLDDKTRPDHRRAHGQIQDIGAPFIVGGALLRFPGDPYGPPAQTYGCRCRLDYRVRASGRYTEPPAGEVTRSPFFVKDAGAWREALHPRDRDGRFIRKGALVRLASGKTGTVTGINASTGRVKVEGEHGVSHVSPRRVTVLEEPRQVRRAVRADDARRAQGQNPSNFPHPMTGHLMGKSEIGDTFEALLLAHGSHMLVEKYGGEYREIARSGGTGSRTTPLDFIVDGRGGEVKTLNAAAPNQKTAMGAAAVRRKEQAVADAGLKPLLVVQVVDQKTMTVQVYVYEAFVSKTVSRMVHVGSYRYTLEHFQRAQERTGHWGKRHQRVAAKR